MEVPIRPYGEFNLLHRRIGIYITYFLLAVQPFHSIVKNYLLYYREFFAIAYILLILPFIPYMIKHYRFPIEVIFLLLFASLLFLFSSFDPGINLYGSKYIEASLQLSNTDPRSYVIRNAILYLPMVIYLSLRGLSSKDIRNIATWIGAIAPINIIVLLHEEGVINSIRDIFNIASTGVGKLGYNSYTPYLSFAFLCCLFTIINTKRKVSLLLYIIIAIYILLYEIISTSRQSADFSAINIIIFTVMSNIRLRYKSLIIAVTLLFMLFLVYYYYTYGYYLQDNVINKFGSTEGAIKTNRFELMIQGLSLLDPSEYIIGAGLTSVIVSGPHNDYVRWTQRIGIPVMIIGFIPFLYAAYSSAKQMLFTRDNISIFIFLCILYTLYHSFFGYPREDAYQALYVYLGLAIWLGFSRNVRFLYSECITIT